MVPAFFLGFFTSLAVVLLSVAGVYAIERWWSGRSTVGERESDDRFHCGYHESLDRIRETLGFQPHHSHIDIADTTVTLLEQTATTSLLDLPDRSRMLKELRMLKRDLAIVPVAKARDYGDAVARAIAELETKRPSTIDSRDRESPAKYY